MARIPIIDLTKATGKSKELLKTVQESLRVTPNLAKALANSPAALESWINFNGALAKGRLDPRTREQIALVVAQTNGCEYCLSAHSVLGKLAGLNDSEIAGSRVGKGNSAKATAALSLARELVEKRGRLPESSIEATRSAGLTDGEIAEIIANVALNVFTNYFNIALDVDVDFPKVSLQQVA